jgi:hypothetical protein
MKPPATNIFVASHRFPNRAFWEDLSPELADNYLILLAVSARLELATFGLGNRCSIRLSCGTRKHFIGLAARGTSQTRRALLAALTASQAGFQGHGS